MTARHSAQRCFGFVFTAVLAIGAMLVAPAGARAQDGGVIVGSVVEAETGQPIGTAQVSIEEISRGTLTQADGVYRLENIPPGDYTVRVTIIGYRPASVEVSVRAGGTARVDFALDRDLLDLEAMVITATQTPRTKLESSNAITTVAEIEIVREQPRSTADLLKTIPGFYVESSGGEVGGNLFARGLPADGSYRYVAVMENGMPVYDATELSFVNADIFIRVDETLERLEAVRGGNSALFGSNAPGGVINFITKTGGPEMSGTMKAEVGTDGLVRYDANVNGPLADDWRFNVGGFYRYDDGIRDAGFPASTGGQLKANVTRLLDNGLFRVHAKYINDRNIFYLPLPVESQIVDGIVELEPELAAGFPSDGTLTSNEGNYVEVPLPTGEDLVMPLENGQQQIGGSLQADLTLELGNGWQLQTSARTMQIDHQVNGLFPSSIVDAATWAQGFVDQFPEATGFELDFTNDAAGGQPGPFLHLGGLWRVDIPLSNTSAQVKLQKELADFGIEQLFTLGAYVGHYTADDNWYFNNVVTEVANSPRFVDLTLTGPGGEVVQQVTSNGFTQFLDLYVNAEGDATVASLFASNEMQINERLRLDVGLRYEHDEFQQNVENTEPVDLGLPTLADDGMAWGTRTRSRVQVDFDEWAASAGANYLLSDQVSIYGRGSRGYKMPILSNYLFATNPADPGFPDQAEELLQFEGGVKVATPWLGLSAVGYWLRLSDFPSQDVQVIDGETQFVTAFVGEAETIGLEFEAIAEPFDGLRLNGTATLQNPEYTEFLRGGEDLGGNEVRRIPDVLLGLDATYSTPFGVAIGGEVNYVGERWSNDENTILLPDFAYVNGRLEWEVPDQGVTLALGVLNLLDGEGLTEGNPRLGAGGQILGPALARPILPRRWTLSARYAF